MADLINELSKQVQAIENYDPSKDYVVLFNNAQTYFEKLAVIRKYYVDNEKYIIDLAKHNLRKSLNIYAFEWPRIFTPIEWDAWQCIRCSGIILYPQYPALNYTLDFANPYLKIALELDGKQFHDTLKDKFRDQKLFDELGWKVFRVTGSEAKRIIPMPNKFPGKYDDEGHYMINEFMHNTLDGIIEALKEVYFLQKKDDSDIEEQTFYDLCVNTLIEHRLANFPV